MVFVDTHSHIYLDDFDCDRDEVIRHSLEEGVNKIVMPNIDSASVKPMLEVAARYPGTCFPLMGLHPTSVNGNYKTELEQIWQWFDAMEFRGVGEIGIDLYWDQTYISEQMDAFRQQLRFARSRNLPAVIHVRDSFTEVMSVVTEEQDGSLKGIFHCFSGNAHDARKVVETGFLLGIGGVVTFKNSSLGQVLKEVPLQSVVLETDSPYLSPVPHRGKRNESGNIPLIAAKVAEIYGISIGEVAASTTAVAAELFRFKLESR